MKKVLSAITSFLLLWGCSTNNVVTTVTPIPPTNLTAYVYSTTQVGLQWTDNSSNEDGYKIQRKTPGGNFTDVASTGTDIAFFDDIGLIPNTTYTYRVYAYNSAGNSIQFSNEVTITTSPIPILTTSPISGTTDISAFCGGNITSDAGSAITARGVVWSTTSGPTVALSTKTTDGSSIGSFSSSITGLTATTTYYVRAYATNNNGTAYGNEVSFSTMAIANLPSVTIGRRVWTSQNLNLSYYNDGTAIPQVTDATQWANLTRGAWCWYNNDSATYWQYGKLYNWYAVQDSRLAPFGWHVATDSEWTDLADSLNINWNYVGGMLKEMGTSHWQSPNSGATNSSGFTALPAGLRTSSGVFYGIGTDGYYWTSTPFNVSSAWYRMIHHNTSGIDRTNFYGRGTAFSVRLVKN